MSDKLPQSKPSLTASSCIKAAVVIPASIEPESPPKKPPIVPVIAPAVDVIGAKGPPAKPATAPTPAPTPAAASAVPATSSLSTKALPIWLKDITVYCSIAVGLSHQPPKNALTPL